MTKVIVNNKFFIILVAYFFLFSSKAYSADKRSENLIEDKDISLYDDRWHINVCAGIGIPQPSLGLLLEKKIYEWLNFRSGLKYGFEIDNRRLWGEDLIKEKNLFDHVDFSFYNTFIISLPLEFEIYPFRGSDLLKGFYFIPIGASFEFLVLDPYISFGRGWKPLCDISVNDFKENNIKLSNVRDFLKLNRFKFTLYCGYGYDFDFGVNIDFIICFKRKNFIDNKVGAGILSMAELYFRFGLDLTKTFELSF